MSDFLSLSVLQLLSVVSFLTSVLAVVCVGSGSLNRLATRPEPTVDTPPMSSITSGKQPLWTWTGLPVSFSIDSLIGEDDQEEPQGYVGGTELTRMDWQVSRSPRIGAFRPPSHHYRRVADARPPDFPLPPVTQTFDSRAPMSMAKLIMSRHVSPYLHHAHP